MEVAQTDSYLLCAQRKTLIRLGGCPGRSESCFMVLQLICLFNYQKLDYLIWAKYTSFSSRTQVSHIMWFPNIRHWWQAKTLIILHISAVWSEPLLVTSTIYGSGPSHTAKSEVSGYHVCLWRMIWVSHDKMATLLEMTWYDSGLQASTQRSWGWCNPIIFCQKLSLQALKLASKSKFSRAFAKQRRAYAIPPAS